APEGRRAPADDRAAGRLGLGEHRVDLLRRAGVVGERDRAPAARVLDDRVLRELLAAPERDHDPAALEEDDVVRRLRARPPAERLVERPRASEVAHAEHDEAETLLHRHTVLRHTGQMAVEVAPWADLLEGEELAHLGVEPARPARTAPIPEALHPRVRERLGIDKLYVHQALAW